MQKQTANVYLMLLILAFLAQVIACMFLYFEMAEYNMEWKVPADLKSSALTMTPSVHAPLDVA